MVPRTLRRSRSFRASTETPPPGSVADDDPRHHAVQFPDSRLDGIAKGQFLKRAAALSLGVMTISRISRDRIVSELGVAPEAVDVLRLPADQELAARVLGLRSMSPSKTSLLPGTVPPTQEPPAPDRVVRADRVPQGWRRLLLVGGKDRAASLAASLDDDQRRYVEIRAHCTQDQVEELLATSLFLVQPSLVEGFGLPVWEALASGLPVCVSDGGALPEITAGFADPFPAESDEGMAEAIDSCATQARHMVDADHFALSSRLLSGAPSVSDFASQFECVIQRYLEQVPLRRIPGQPTRTDVRPGCP